MDSTVQKPLRSNPVFWLIWLIPAATVLAGFATLAIAMQGADRALPPSYHWEGERLDADFERVREAARLGVAITLQLDAEDQCIAQLRVSSPEPDALNVQLAHGSDASLDRVVRLTRSAVGDYRAACDALPPGNWRVVVSDAASSWEIRARIEGSPRRVEIQARLPEGNSQ